MTIKAASKTWVKMMGNLHNSEDELRRQVSNLSRPLLPLDNILDFYGNVETMKMRISIWRQQNHVYHLL